MVIFKGSYIYGDLKNVMPYLVQKPYLAVWDHKLPCFMGVCIRQRMEICKTLGLSIPMVPRLHQSSAHIKRKLHVWRAQKCNALVSAETVLTSEGRKLPHFKGGSTRLRMEICEIWGHQIPMVPCLHQSDGYFKRKLRLWRSQKM